MKPIASTSARLLVGAATSLGLLCGPILSASATVMLPISLEEMSQEANAIVRAQVVEKTSRWDSDKRRRIYTYTTLEVLDRVHADVPLQDKVIVRTLGGEVGEVGMRVAGTPSFTVGEEVLVFLRKDQRVKDAFVVIGMAQGKYRLKKGDKGEVIAEPSLEGIAFARPGQDGVLRVDESKPITGPVLFTELKSKILEAVQNKPKAAPAPADDPKAPAPPSVEAPAQPASTSK